MTWLTMGAVELTVVSGGRFKLDGGSMFGIVPKALWERTNTTDEKNRIDMGMNCALIRTSEKLLLVDVGFGTKLGQRQKDIYAIDDSVTLLASLKKEGVEAEEVDIVVLSHLHLDHCGGSTRYDSDGEIVPTFPNAEYVVQKGEWKDALNNFGTMKTTYIRDNFAPLMDAEVLRLLEGDVEICDGVSVFVTGGHTRHHQGVLIESKGQKAVFPADIMPTTSHLKGPYNMAYDLFPYDTMMKKLELLRVGSEEGWIFMWDHDPSLPIGKVESDGKGEFKAAPLSE